jgi:hypothetical protein
MRWDVPLSNAQVEAVGAARELQVTTYRPDGSTRKAIPIWVVAVQDTVYIRSAYGPDAGWYRHAIADNRLHIEAGNVSIDVSLQPNSDSAVNDGVDSAYRAKYAGSGSALNTMVSSPATETTIELVPHQ